MELGLATFADLMRAMAPANVVIATRYHNLICALMLAKPTLSVGYGVKNAVLMEDMGLAEYSQLVHSLDIDQLIKQFTELESQAAPVRQLITDRDADYRALVERQFAELSAVLPLLPGDVIFTGTPDGVGMARQPPRFLQPGQVLETWIEGIGTIRNPCVHS